MKIKVVRRPEISAYFKPSGKEGQWKRTLHNAAGGREAAADVRGHWFIHFQCFATNDVISLPSGGSGSLLATCSMKPMRAPVVVVSVCERSHRTRRADVD